VLAPNLRLVRQLASGGMGSVWIAEHASLRTEVAVKFLAGVAADHPIATRFEHEAPTTARIKSPHVVQILDHGVAADGVAYIVMELLAGETLGTRLSRVGTLSLLETAAIVVQVCRCLTTAHAAQVVHRDIKPDNLFLIDSAGDLFVKILDFGIAKDGGQGALHMTLSGATMGTPHYMSPEQIVNARAVTPAADLWAVAVVAYLCLTGSFPFRAETYGGLAIAIAKGHFPPISEKRAELAELDPWFERALTLDAAQRFPSARELADRFVAAAGVSLSDVAAVPSGISSAAPGDGAGSAHTLTASFQSIRVAVAPAGRKKSGAAAPSPATRAVIAPNPAAQQPPRSNRLLLFAVPAGVVVAGAVAWNAIGRDRGAPTVMIVSASPTVTPAITATEEPERIALPARERAAVPQEDVPTANSASSVPAASSGARPPGAPSAARPVVNPRPATTREHPKRRDYGF
jgi:serine/threonine-protein kinase